MKPAEIKAAVEKSFKGTPVVWKPRFNDKHEHICVKCGADVEAYPDSQASAILVCQSQTCGHRYVILF